MDTQELFLTIQNSTDYREDPEGCQINWKYIKKGQTVYILCQETKTKKDWFYNFLFFPVLAKINGKFVLLHFGWYLLAKKLFKYVVYDLMYDDNLGDANSIVFTGWSAGAAVAQIVGAMVADRCWDKLSFCGYGMPAFCWTQKSRIHLETLFFNYVNFLYERDWIKYIVPFCKRYVNGIIKPWTEPKTLDERHRVYGKSALSPAEI